MTLEIILLSLCPNVLDGQSTQMLHGEKKVLRQRSFRKSKQSPSSSWRPSVHINVVIALKNAAVKKPA